MMQLSSSLRLSLLTLPSTLRSLRVFSGRPTSSTFGLSLSGRPYHHQPRVYHLSLGGTSTTTPRCALFFAQHSSTSSPVICRALSSCSIKKMPPTAVTPASASASAGSSEDLNSILNSSKSGVVIFTKDGCPYCEKAKALLTELSLAYREVRAEAGTKIREALGAKVGRTSLPQTFANGVHLGGCDDLLGLHAEGKLVPAVRGHAYDYDLIVIGGGSGGLAASKEAAALGKKVALLDFVAPSPLGTTWGLGGTCVNVGCIPKKLMHHASLRGQDLEDDHFFGWVHKTDGSPIGEHTRHDWSTLVGNVQANIKSSNFGYRTLLRETKVNYLNAYGALQDAHTINLKHKNGKTETLTSNHFIVATGERPRYPSGVEGAQLAITSDDLFQLPSAPGKTLIIGASYVALECAGFLRGFGYDVTVMVRSFVLRGFDRQCSELVRKYMEETEKVKFIDASVPKKLEKLDSGLIKVTYQTGAKEEHTGEYQTIMMAVGRDPCTSAIGLTAAGVQKEKSGYLKVVHEQTNIPNIYAVGDILAGKPQLTPVAIEAGILLARRLYGNGTAQCDYANVPTTVFTPLEYGCCGLSEEEAIEKYGSEGIDVYHQYFTPTEWYMCYFDRPKRTRNACYVKVITTRSAKNDPHEERLLGLHYVGPNAGEVAQFFAMPLKMKGTKADLDRVIGIHPTCAEIFTSLTVTKRSGKDATQKGCCG